MVNTKSKRDFREAREKEFQEVNTNVMWILMTAACSQDANYPGLTLAAGFKEWNIYNIIIRLSCPKIEYHSYECHTLLTTESNKYVVVNGENIFCSSSTFTSC